MPLLIFGSGGGSGGVGSGGGVPMPTPGTPSPAPTGVSFGSDYPTLYIEIGISSGGSGNSVWDVAQWDTAVFGPDILWVEVTPLVRQLSTHLGRASEGERYYGGMSMILDNRSGDFTPGNLAGLYVVAGVSQIRPRVPVRVRAEWDGMVYPIGYGYVDDWGGQLPEHGRDDLVVVSIVDAWWKLASVNPFAQNPVGAGETAGQRIQRIATAAEWTLPTNVQNGSATMQATTLAQNLSSEALLTADSEGGAVWVDPDGTLVFEGRYSLVESTRSNTSRVTFGPDDDEIPYRNVIKSSGSDRLVNTVQLSRAGGHEQQAVDLTARALYGQLTYGRNDLISETDATVAAIAEFTLAARKDPDDHPTQLNITPVRDPDLMWPWALGLRIRDRVTVKVNSTASGVTTTHSCFVEGIQHDIVPGWWETTISFSSATAYDSFTTSVWDAGRFDSATWFF